MPPRLGVIDPTGSTDFNTILAGLDGQSQAAIDEAERKRAEMIAERDALRGSYHDDRRPLMKTFMSTIGGLLGGGSFEDSLAAGAELGNKYVNNLAEDEKLKLADKTQDINFIESIITDERNRAQQIQQTGLTTAASMYQNNMLGNIPGSANARLKMAEAEGSHKRNLQAEADAAVDKEKRLNEMFQIEHDGKMVGQKELALINTESGIAKRELDMALKQADDNERTASMQMFGSRKGKLKSTPPPARDKLAQYRDFMEGANNVEDSLDILIKHYDPRFKGTTTERKPDEAAVNNAMTGLIHNTSVMHKTGMSMTAPEIKLKIANMTPADFFANPTTGFGTLLNRSMTNVTPLQAALEAKKYFQAMTRTANTARHMILPQQSVNYSVDDIKTSPWILNEILVDNLPLSPDVQAKMGPEINQARMAIQMETANQGPQGSAGGITIEQVMAKIGEMEARKAAGN